MPIRMLYEPNSHESVEIDVYHFHQLDDNLECFVTAWVVDKEYWLTVPLSAVKPIKKSKKKKELLNE